MKSCGDLRKFYFETKENKLLENYKYFGRKTRVNQRRQISDTITKRRKVHRLHVRSIALNLNDFIWCNAALNLHRLNIAAFHLFRCLTFNSFNAHFMSKATTRDVFFYFLSNRAKVVSINFCRWRYILDKWQRCRVICYTCGKDKCFCAANVAPVWMKTKNSENVPGKHIMINLYSRKAEAVIY